MRKGHPFFATLGDASIRRSSLYPKLQEKGTHSLQHLAMLPLDAPAENHRKELGASLGYFRPAGPCSLTHSMLTPRAPAVAHVAGRRPTRPHQPPGLLLLVCGPSPSLPCQGPRKWGYHGRGRCNARRHPLQGKGEGGERSQARPERTPQVGGVSPQAAGAPSEELTPTPELVG